MGYLNGYPSYVLLQFSDGTHIGKTELIDYDSSESFSYEKEHIVFWPCLPSNNKKPKRYPARVLLFSGEHTFLIIYVSHGTVHVSYSVLIVYCATKH